MLDQELLDILACPETKEPVHLADEALVQRVNAAIDAKKLHNRDGEAVTERIEAGLVRQDGKYLYPVRDDIPVMLIGEAIELSQVS
jgi:uncharacterized protein YbaR (Trm112 family)